MKNLGFSYRDTCLVDMHKLERMARKLVPEMERIQSARSAGYATPYASINVLSDEPYIARIKALAAEKQRQNPTLLIIIGIGGSNLGAVAVHKAVRGPLYNAFQPQMQVAFVDTVDADSAWDIIQLTERRLQRGERVICNVITKSGTTIETIANFEIFLALLKQYCPTTYADSIVVTTDHGSILHKRAEQEGFAMLDVPAQVGGRYSVFSAVGLFPLALLGVDIDLLRQGACDMLELALSDDIFANMSALSATIQFLHYRDSTVAISDLFVFSRDLEALGKWYRQLMGESIGKEFNVYGESVRVGITPTVSLGSIDLHSVAQLYLGGPKDKFTTFVTVEASRSSVKVPDAMACLACAPDLAGKSFEEIMLAISQGVEIAYYKDQRPFCAVVMPQKNEYYVGQFLQFKMLEIMYMAFLLEVNPFDQPNVDAYKRETHAILQRRLSHVGVLGEL